MKVRNLPRVPACSEIFWCVDMSRPSLLIESTNSMITCMGEKFAEKFLPINDVVK